MSLEGKVALVTGANRGIGAACAIGLAARGASVAVHYHSDAARAEGVVAEIAKAGGTAFIVQADVRDREAARRMAGLCADRLGPVDILVNSARQMGVKKTFLDLDWSDYTLQIDVILKGALHVTQAVLPSMIERRSGRIINMMTTVLDEPSWRWHTYGAAKGALHQMSRNLAAELGPRGITVNMVSPGFVPTDRGTPHGDSYLEDYVALTPMGRFGRAGEIADAVAFLASEDAAFITGANLPVSGGKAMV